MSKRKNSSIDSPKESDRKNNSFSKKIILLVGIVFVTIISYIKGFDPEKEFTNWDDLGYVVNQPLTKTTDPDSVNLLFNPATEVMLNYHPLTMLTLRANYQHSGLDISSYFTSNLGLHLCNVILVFFLLFELGRGSLFIAGFGALIFAVHPMHVESVAWISERKDVLYAFFFISALLTYLKFLKEKKYFWLITTFLLFICSCLSKAMAVPLPIVLFLLDYFYNRRFSLKQVLEKTPFFILALWFGYNAVKIQATGAIAEYEVFTTFQRIMFASYGYIMYWMKFIFPFELSAFYPYPTFGEQKQLPFIYYASPLIAITITFLPFFYILKRKKEWFKSYVFGIGFFIATIILVLQFISVGAAIMADRYSYIPFIGSIFLLLYLIEQSNLFKNKKNYFIVGFTALSVIFSIQCYKMVETWTNSETLWSNVIELFPYRIEQNGNVVKIIENGVEVAYKNRGNYYRENGRMDLAFEDYEVLVRARVNDPLVYSNMGNMYAMENKFDKSIEMYKLALERDKKIFDVYLNRGITFGKMGKHEEAIKDYHSALEIRKNDLQTSILMCHEYLNAQQFDEVINNVEPIIKNQPTNFEGYFLRGTANVNKGNFNLAIADLNKSIDLNPNYPYSWYNSSIAYNAVGDKKNALDRALKAKSLGMNINENYLMGLR